ncbi:MAG: hypothetical protein HN877_00220 [Rhodospirillaceae bacterium]|nr:hypothetical protein [Rhodospirillaceae bacterium]
MIKIPPFWNWIGICDRRLEPMFVTKGDWKFTSPPGSDHQCVIGAQVVLGVKEWAPSVGRPGAGRLSGLTDIAGRLDPPARQVARTFCWFSLYAATHTTYNAAQLDCFVALLIATTCVLE